MKRKRREFEIFSLSFLDVMTCGLGAMILLLLILRTGEPVVLEETPESLDGVVADLQEHLFEIRGEATVMNRDLNAKREQLSQWKQRVARLQGELSALENLQAKVAEGASEDSALTGELRLAVQELTEEMQRLLSQTREPQNEYVGGIPVDSEYVIFVIDTSGSMFQFAWDRVMEEMINVLNIYPKLKGLQILNDEGTYMFPKYRGKWITDTEARRKIIISQLARWNPFSNSSPEEGINRAIKDFYSADRKISIYYFGDDFRGGSLRQILDIVERLNPKGKDGQPQVRIHAIGFPTQFFSAQTLG
ncbi:MAG: VWA domain-containing protein, partial [Gammaproteobacteria bacterium]